MLRTSRRAGAAVLAAAGFAMCGAAPAHALPRVSADGSVGSAAVVVDGTVSALDALAPCALGGTTAGSTRGGEVGGVVRFGSGTSTCETDPATGYGTVTVKGNQFRLDALDAHDGPVIRLSTFTATCSTTATGSRSSFSFTGLSGVAVPPTIPVGYTVTVPGPTPDAPPLADLVFHEQVLPDPPDGSMTVHVLHVKLFPEGGPDSGDIYAGTVHCDPTV